MSSESLERGISESQIGWVALGGIIGSCYFLGAGLVLEELGILAPIAFALTGLIVFAVMQALCELQVNLPNESSFVGYSKEFFGSTIACGIGITYISSLIFYVPSEAVAGGTIANMFVPSVPINVFAGLFLALILGLNLVQVSNFSAVSTIMAVSKVMAIGLFCVFALFAIFGIFTNPVGMSILMPAIAEKQAMFGVGFMGVVVFIGQMVMLMMSQSSILLVNYHGFEIVGLAAAETQNPAESIPKAARNAAYQIVGMFVIPMFLLCAIFPAAKAGVASSPFADALTANGFGWLAVVFTVVVLISAVSCANGAFYSGVRAIHGLAVEKLIPSRFSRLNSNSVPMNAALMMAFCCIVALVVSILNGDSNVYAALLSLSGITGTFCWISIGISLFEYRRTLENRGFDTDTLKVPANLTYVMMFGILVPFTGIVMMGFSEDYQLSYHISCAVLVLSLLIHKCCEVLGLTQDSNVEYDGQLTFDEMYPVTRRIPENQ